MATATDNDWTITLRKISVKRASLLSVARHLRDFQADPCRSRHLQDPQQAYPFPEVLRQATQLLSDEREGEKTFCEGHGRALRGNFPAPLVRSECQLSAPYQAGMLQAAERHHGTRRIQTF